MKVGDKVLYVPHEDHAFDEDRDGNFAWAFGERRHQSRVSRPGQPPPQEEEPRRLSNTEVRQKRDAIRKEGAVSNSRSKLVRLHPIKPWPAVVTEVNDDGTVNLDIQAARSGVTLHYKNISVVDISKNQPHSCCPPTMNEDGHEEEESK